MLSKISLCDKSLANQRSNSSGCYFVGEAAEQTKQQQQNCEEAVRLYQEQNKELKELLRKREREIDELKNSL
jgi:predicted RNase H-like nuclease (RuvC/YqgF family)